MSCCRPLGTISIESAETIYYFLVYDVQDIIDLEDYASSQTNLFKVRPKDVTTGISYITQTVHTKKNIFYY